MVAVYDVDSRFIGRFDAICAKGKNKKRILLVFFCEFGTLFVLLKNKKYKYEEN